jgi:hypothetical protein
VAIFPIMPIFLLLLYTTFRKPFILTKDCVVFCKNRLIIKTQKPLDILISELEEIDFSYSGFDNGFYHPIFNRNPNNGDSNILTFKTKNDFKRLDLYLPKSSDKIRMMNILKNYRDLIKSNC